MADLTPAQTRYFLEHLPDVAFRHAYPLASLEAAVLNAMGGKPDPNDKKAKPLDPSRVYTPSERLPPYARPSWLSEAPTGVPPDAARDFQANRKRIPLWALQVAPLDAITAAAS